MKIVMAPVFTEGALTTDTAYIHIRKPGAPKKPTQTQKKCSTCRRMKLADEYYVGKTGRLYPRCKACIVDFNRDQNIKHRIKRVNYDRSRGSGWNRSGRDHWNDSAPDKHDKYLKRMYGISLRQYEDMFNSQGKVCAICKCECNRSNTTRLCVDHDHKTDIVRGLLCFQCNVGLGKFKDNVDLLNQAAQYLKERLN